MGLVKGGEWVCRGLIVEVWWRKGKREKKSERERGVGGLGRETGKVMGKV